MPLPLLCLAAALGFTQALIPTLILVGAIAFQHVLTITGRLNLLRRAITRVTPDPRLQLIFISFCYGSLLEAIAGGGTPVLITVSMLVGLGFNGFQAARNSLLANSTPVAFGAIGLPFVYMALVTGLPLNRISAMVGSQIPFTALLVPFVLVLLFEGRRGIRATWPAIVVVSVVFAGAQALCAHILGPYLPDIVASLLSMIAFTAFLGVWRPKRPYEPQTSRSQSRGAGNSSDDRRAWSQEFSDAEANEPLTRKELVQAWSPLLLLVAVIGFWGSPWGNHLLAKTDVHIPWPMLNGAVIRVTPVVFKPTSLSAVWNINWLSSGGTGLVVTALLVAVLAAGFRALPVFGRAMVESTVQLRHAIVVGLGMATMAFVMNYAGATSTIGLVVAGTGALFPLFSAFIGWVAVFTTGSDTSASLLFGNLQTTAAHAAGFDPVLAAGTNISAGATAKMISPLELTVATSAGGLAGREGELFRKLLPWSLGLMIVIGLLALLQGHVLTFMIP